MVKKGQKLLSIVLSLIMLAAVSCVPVGAEEATVVRVASSNELLAAISSDATVILDDGVYEISAALSIYGIENLTIKAENSGKAEILSTDGYNPVVSVNNSKNISLDGLILGHQSLSYQEGCGDSAYSSGYVLYGYSSENITVSGCDLYGCGTVGTVLRGVKGFVASGCVIRDCKEYIAYISASYSGEESEGVVFENCTISGNAYDNSYASAYPAVYAGSPVAFRDCRFLNNRSTVFVSSDNADNVTVDGCTFENNIWDSETPGDYGICLNGITWQIEKRPINEYQSENILRLGFPLELEGSTIESEIGEILPYSSYSLPWRGYSTINGVEVEEGVIYNIGGMCGDNLTWKLNLADGRLTVSGSGAMYDYSSSLNRPWASYTKLIKSVEISEGVTSLGFNSFYGCYGLSEVILPEGLETIGSYAFSGCYAIKSVDLPESLKSIENGAFGSCTSLEEITIPKNMEVIGSDVFSSCTALTSVNVDAENPAYTSVDGVLFDKDVKTLIHYPSSRPDSDYTLPATVETVSEFSFYHCSNLVNLTFPEGVRTLEHRALVRCENLETVSLPASLNDNVIEDWSDVQNFSGCTKLKKIDVAEGNEAFASVGGVLFSKDKTVLVAYPSACGLTYVIPQGVRRIEACAFMDSNILAVEFPNTIEEIGNNAFSDCENLSSVVMPQNTATGTKIGDYAFFYCKSLTAAVLPVTVTTFGYSVFRQSNNVIIYCKSGSAAETYAKNNGHSYSDISEYNEYTASGDGWSIKNGILNITADFQDTPWEDYYDSVKIISVEEGVTSLPDFAFSGLRYVISVSLPESLESIGSYAFSNLYKLESLEIGKNVSQIGSNAFNGCDSLEKITVSPENLYFTTENGILYSKDITKLVFFPSSINYTSYTLPASVTEIESRALTGYGGVAALTEILVEEGSASYASVDGVLFSLDKTVLVSYPAANTREFYQMPDTVTCIGEYAFASAGNLTGLEFSSNLREIKNNAFTSCRKLTEVTLPRSMRTLGFGAFQNCIALKKVVAAKGLETIDRSVFNYCPALEEAIIPSSVTSIGQNAFNNCENITIYGTEGSIAQTYAEENSIPFEAITEADPVITEVTAANDGGAVEVTVEAQNTEGALLFAVGYTSVGEVAASAYVTDGEARLDSESVSTVKVFCWESLGSMKPLCEVKTVTVKSAAVN